MYGYVKNINCGCSPSIQGVGDLLTTVNTNFWEETLPKRADGKRVFTTVIEFDFKSAMFLAGAIAIAGFIIKKL